MVFVGCFWNLLVALGAIVCLVAQARKPDGAVRKRRVFELSMLAMAVGTALSEPIAFAWYRYTDPVDGWNDVVSGGALVFSGISLAVLGPLVCLAYYLAQRGRIARFGQRHCICGYDLTGNESGRCPECGIDVPSSRSKVR